MRSFGYPDPYCHVPQPSLSNEDCSNFQRRMNARVYLNLFEPDSIMKDDKDYSLAIMLKYKC